MKFLMTQFVAEVVRRLIRFNPYIVDGWAADIIDIRQSNSWAHIGIYIYNDHIVIVHKALTHQWSYEDVYDPNFDPEPIISEIERCLEGII